MNILFLTIGRMDNIEEHAIYTDLLRHFRDNGHSVYTVSAYEKRTGKDTSFVEESGVHVLRVKIGNITKCGMIEKGISTLRIESQYINAIKKYLKDVKFDLVMYSTPPITFAKAVKFIKKRDGAKSYLLLKDIFPQNALDIGVMSKSGVKGILYSYFRKVEKELYSFSDYIGCMSQANVDYVLKHNPEVPADKVGICPNSIEIRDMSLSVGERIAMREKYGLPLDKKVFVYGGNLGKPQGISFLIECLRTQLESQEAYFFVVGDGTDYGKLEKFFDEFKPDNMMLMKRLPKEDYDRLVATCDVGLVFLDHRFTIPNFPSRILAYMQAKLPILACTDPNTDVGRVIVDGNFGLWCESNDTVAFADAVKNMQYSEWGENGYKYLCDNYSVKYSYDTIMKFMKE